MRKVAKAARRCCSSAAARLRGEQRSNGAWLFTLGHGGSSQGWLWPRRRPRGRSVRQIAFLVDIRGHATRCTRYPGRPCRRARASRLHEQGASAADCRRFTMRYLALGCDYDGTLAHHGASTRRPRWRRWSGSSRRGGSCSWSPAASWTTCSASFAPARPVRPRRRRERRPALHAGDREETRCWPSRRRERSSQALQRARRRAAVGRPRRSSPPGSRTRRPCCEAIRDLGLELQVIFNKGAVMVLPAGVNKATGPGRRARASWACRRTTSSASATPRTTTPSCAVCECSAAVANALPALKERADIVTRGDHGAGVAELIDELRRRRPAPAAQDRLERHHLLLGTRRRRSRGRRCRPTAPAC